MRGRTTTALQLAAILGTLPWVADAGVIRGVVGVPAAHRKFSRIGNEPTGPVRRRLECAGDAVVYLDSIPDNIERQFAKKAGAPVMVQQRGAFVPRTLYVTAGSTVTFLNRDRVYHSVFSVSPTQKFALGKYKPGASVKQTFDTPGPVELFCEFDPEELGYIFVAPNHACTRASSSGNFTFPKLPPGTYRLMVWHPAYGTQSREIEVPKRGEVVVALEL